MSELEGLGRRAVACKGWRPLPGMLDERGYRVLSVEDGIVTTSELVLVGPPWLQQVEHATCALEKHNNVEPNLSDPATVGCLLTLVREAFPDAEVWVARACEPETPRPGAQHSQPKRIRAAR